MNMYSSKTNQERGNAVANENTSKTDSPAQKKENNTGLPDSLKTGIEHLSGYSMDDVKVHYNSDKPAQLHAHAYAQGTQIHLGPGQERHLPHEAWHVVQQKQGRVKPTIQMKGKININDDAGLEKEADEMGKKAINATQRSPSILQNKLVQNTSLPIQRASQVAEITWGVTHLVRKMNNSLFGGENFREGEVPYGELRQGQKIVIDDHKTFLSRRGSNQEDPVNRERDKRSLPPSVLWYHVKYLNGEDIRGEKLYVRNGTFRIVEKFPEAISTGTIEGQTIPHGDGRITAVEAQDRIFRAFRESDFARAGKTQFRVATFKFTPEAGLVRNTDPVYEDHGMEVNLTDQVIGDGLLGLIRGLTKNTMHTAGQLNYLLANWESISRTHLVAIDVDVYLDRMGNVGFHKDSRGRTLFVNLTYDNDSEIQGPEWIRDDNTADTGLTASFPDVVKRDINTEKDSHRGDTDIHTRRLPTHGRVSFSDPNFYHSTPLGRRRITWDSVDFHDPNSYLPALRAHFRSNEERVQKVVQDYIRSGRIDELKEALEREPNWPEAFNTVNVQKESGLGKPEEASISRDIRSNRNRRLSRVLEGDRVFAAQLAQESARPRAFIRTWVRLVPKTHVEPGKRDRWIG